MKSRRPPSSRRDALESGGGEVPQAAKAKPEARTSSSAKLIWESFTFYRSRSPPLDGSCCSCPAGDEAIRNSCARLWPRVCPDVTTLGFTTSRFSSSPALPASVPPGRPHLPSPLARQRSPRKATMTSPDSPHALRPFLRRPRRAPRLPQLALAAAAACCASNAYAQLLLEGLRSGTSMTVPWPEWPKGTRATSRWIRTDTCT